MSEYVICLYAKAVSPIDSGGWYECKIDDKDCHNPWNENCLMRKRGGK